ncbi:MAG: hypothetical protein Q8O56_13730 [Solirubrobacteraceae bacterium]|nr:hypothetical protein [Solirubrobacteraceae bacterium]
MRSTRGQATLDYVALIAVLAVLFTVALGLAAGGAPGIVNAVVGQVRHALCVVTGGPCPDERARPCIVASTRDTKHIALNLLVVRLDRDRYVLRERMSDGTVRLTVARRYAAGAEGGIGGRLRVTSKRRAVGGSGEARAGLQGVLARGRVFVARDDREADTFMRAIRDGRQPPSPVREDVVEGGVQGAVRAGIGGPRVGASLDRLSTAMIGARHDRRTGNVTLSLDAGSSGWGAVKVAIGGPAGTARGATTFALTLDRDRRPIELAVLAGGALAAGTTLPLTIEGPGGNATSSPVTSDATGSAARGGGRRWELAARLDLRDPLAAATWANFRRNPTSGAAVGALGAAIRDRAFLDVRTYRTDSSSTGVGVGVAFGVRLGGEIEDTSDRSRLLEASSRPPGGLWESRFDCVPS